MQLERMLRYPRTGLSLVRRVWLIMISVDSITYRLLSLLYGIQMAKYRRSG